MILDSHKRTLYVYGGRKISPDPTQIAYSGLYSYSIGENRWRHLSGSSAENTDIKPRIGHSMLFNHKTREIYIFAGQRHKDFLADFHVYNVDTGIFTEWTRDYSKIGGPDAGFTQRATIDPEAGEIYILSGIMREKNSGSETKNSFWVFSLESRSWTKIYENENLGSDHWSQPDLKEPRPRFAHQIVNSPRTGCQYLFGGNPGESAHPNLRLDDFWGLTLVRPSTADILRKGRFMIRKQKFIELARIDKKQALLYLQSSVEKMVNQDDDDELKEFRSLAMNLFPIKVNKLADNISVGGMVVDQSLDRSMFF